MATLIKVDGTTTEIECSNKNKLKFYQDIIGGNIQCLYSKSGGIRRHSVMIMDEEGKFKGRGLNKKATKLAIKEFNLDTDDFIAGDVLICKYPSEFN